MLITVAMLYLYLTTLSKGYGKKILIEIPMNPASFVSGLGANKLSRSLASLPSSLLGFYTDETDFSQQVIDYSEFVFSGKESVKNKIKSKFLFTGNKVKDISLSESRKFIILEISYDSDEQRVALVNGVIDMLNGWYHKKKDIVGRQIAKEESAVKVSSEKLNKVINKLERISRQVGGNPIILGQLNQAMDSKDFIVNKLNAIDRSKMLMRNEEFLIAHESIDDINNLVKRPTNSFFIFILISLWVFSTYLAFVVFDSRKINV